MPSFAPSSQPHHAEYPAQPPPVHPRDDDDTKAPYDDLLDTYATSYGAPTYALDPASMNMNDSRHGRRPSFPLTHQPNLSSSSTTRDFKSLEGGAQDWEYPPTVAKEAPAESGWKKYIPDSLACRLYVLTVLVETIIDLAIEADLILRFQTVDTKETDNMATKRMPVYLSIFAMAHIFQFLMALNAVYNRNTLQFISLTLFNAVFLLYAIIQISEITSVIPTTTSGITSIPIQVLAIIIPVVISVAEMAYLGLAWKIYQEFGWKVYKFLGADRKMKTIFTYYQVYLCLVKFDLFFWVGFSVQFIWLVLDRHDAEYYLTCAALPLSVIVLIEGHLAARHENKWMMCSFLVGCGGAMVYFVYKLVKVLRLKNTPQFIEVYKTLTNFTIIAILVLLATIIFALLVMSNFGRGLKKQIAKSTEKQGLQRGKSQYVHHGPMATHPNRMSID